MRGPESSSAAGPHRLRPWLAAGAAAALLATGMVAGQGTRPVAASSHVDAISTILDPQIDASGLFAFTSPDKPDSVTVIATYVPFQIPPIPYPWATDARYELHADTTGDGKPEVTYRFTFRNDDGTEAPRLPPSKGYGNSPELKDYLSEAGQLYPVDDSDPDAEPPPSSTDRRAGKGRFAFVNQHFAMEELRPGKDAKTVVKSGTSVSTTLETAVTAIGYSTVQQKRIETTSDGVKVSAGQAKDPFYFDARIFGLTRTGVPILPPVDIFAPFNINYVAIQIPKKVLALKGDPKRNPVVGIWTTAHRKSLNLSGGPDKYRQVSRYGNIFVDTIARNMGDRFNQSTTPDQDHKDKYLLGLVRDPAAAQYMQPGTLTFAPPRPRKDLEEILLTGITGKMGGPIKEELNSHQLNKDADTKKIVPAEELRLNMSTPVTEKPDRYGYIAGDKQGFPNGMRLTDDNETIQARMLMGEPHFHKQNPLVNITTTALVGNTVKPMQKKFPYIPTPDVR